jgi:glycosyltransferase involved in cell wall biosynthesis
MTERVIVFGMNSMFAVRQFLPDVLDTVRQRGFRAVVVAPPDSEPVPSAEGVVVVAIPMKREIAPLSDLCALWRMWRLLRSIRPVVANMSTPKMALVGGLAAWLAGVPNRIYTLRGLRYETTSGWKRALLMSCERAACACAHRVICISRSVKQALLRDGIVREGKITMLGRRVSEGIGIARETATEETLRLLRRGLEIPDCVPVIGFVGRLTRDKGVEELIEAFRMLREGGNPVELLVVGDFEAGDRVNETTEQWIRYGDGVHWAGYVADPSPYYRLMDVFVFPTHREGLGRVLLEAAAAGRPVVSTLTTGVVDVVLDGVTGLLVSPGDAQELARATATLLGDAAMAERMAGNARALVEEEFDNSIYLKRLADVLDSLARLNPVSRDALCVSPQR